MYLISTDTSGFLIGYAYIDFMYISFPKLITWLNLCYVCDNCIDKIFQEHRLKNYYSLPRYFLQAPFYLSQLREYYKNVWNLCHLHPGWSLHFPGKILFSRARWYIYIVYLTEKCIRCGIKFHKRPDGFEY